LTDQDFAVVIGISKYRWLRPLDGPVRDAENMRNWLLDCAAVPADHLEFVVTEEDDENPTAAKVHDALTRVVSLARHAEARRLYVYFAGHGLSVSLSHLLLLAANASRDNLGRGIDTRKYHEALGNLPLFPEQLFFYDSCRYYDWRALGQGPEWTSGEPEPPRNLTRMIFYGTGFRDFASERLVRSEKRGLFTVALLEGLAGCAAVSIEGEYRVTAAGLARFVRSRLATLARTEGLEQGAEPMYIGNPEEFVLVRQITPCQQTVEVKLPGDGGVLVVENEHLREIERRRLTGREPCVALQLLPGRYVVKVVPGGPGRIIDVGVGPGPPIDFGEQGDDGYC
jgi:Caspase domain